MKPRRLAVYALALLLPLAMLAVRQAMPVAFGARTMLILFMLPIIVCALLGGLGPGLLATAAAGGLTAYFLVPPIGSFALAAGHDLVQWGMLLANGVVVSLMSHILLRTQRRESAAKAEQRQSEVSFRAIFEQASVGITQVAEDGRFLRVNGKFCEIVGYSRDELLSRSFMEITHPDDLPGDLEQVRRLHAGEIPSFTREKRFLRKDGTAVWGRIHITAVRKPDGTPDYRIGVLVDISEAKALEDGLRESERRLGEASRLAKLGHWHWNLTTDVHAWSEEIYHIYGRDPALPAAVYPEVQLYFTPETWAGLAAAVEQCLADGLPYEREAQVVRSDGSHAWITARGTALRDAMGCIVALHGTVQDITTHKETERALAAMAEQQSQARRAALNLLEEAQAARENAEAANAALAESESRLRLLIDEAPVALALFDRDMRYLAVSRHWREDYELGDRDVFGHAHYTLFPELPEQWKAAHRRGLAGDVVRSDGDAFTRRDGQTIWARWQVLPWRDADGGIGGILIFSENITEQKLAQDALRESESRFRALVEQSLAGIYIVQDGRFRYVNPGFAAMFGYGSADEIIELVSFSELVMPDDQAKVAEHVRRRAEGEISDSHYTFAGRHREGRRMEVEVHGRRFDYQGRPAVIGLILDITARKAAEDSLRESELRFHDIVNASADWVWEVDARGRYTYASESVRDLLGYGPEELLGKTPFDLIPSEHVEHLAAQFAAIARRKAPFRDLENVNRRKDGRLIHVATNGMPILDAQGELLGYRGLDRDITENKAAEAALRESEQRFRTLVDQAADAVFVHDHDGRFLEVNRLACENTGYDRHELLAMTVSDLEQDFDLAAAQALWDRAQPGQHFTIEGEHRRKDGSVFPVEVRFGLMTLAGHRVYISLVRDITERKLAQAALAEREARYRAVIESTPDGFWVVDAQGHILISNEAYVRLSGYSLEELKHLRVSDIEAMDSIEDIRARTEQILRDGSAVFEGQHRTKDGRIWPVEVAVSYWPERGYMFAFLRDITERKAAETEIKDRNDELERFNRATVGRELDMLEMKKTINALSRELGREPPYSLAFLKEMGEPE